MKTSIYVYNDLFCMNEIFRGNHVMSQPAFKNILRLISLAKTTVGRRCWITGLRHSNTDRLRWIRKH